MRESTIEKAVCDHARKNGCMVMKLAGPNQKGQPDRMFLKNGRVLFLEFKAPGKKPTALQEKWLRDLWAQQHAAVWVDSVSAGISALGRYIL
jgi:hypothetical protein